MGEIEDKIVDKIAALEVKVSALLDAKDVLGTKPWYQSKTIWVNIIAIIAFIAQAFMGYPVAAGTEAVALGIINLFLRAFTSKPLE